MATVSLPKKFLTRKEANNHYNQLTGATQKDLQGCKELLKWLSSQEQLRVVSVLYSEFVNSQDHPAAVPADFLQLAFSAACHLHDSGRSDVIYLIAKVLGTMRLDKSDSQGECQLG